MKRRLSGISKELLLVTEYGGSLGRMGGLNLEAAMSLSGLLAGYLNTYKKNQGIGQAVVRTDRSIRLGLRHRVRRKR